jgi:hypothetical protein
VVLNPIQFPFGCVCVHRRPQRIDAAVKQNVFNALQLAGMAAKDGNGEKSDKKKRKYGCDTAASVKVLTLIQSQVALAECIMYIFLMIFGQFTVFYHDIPMMSACKCQM